MKLKYFLVLFVLLQSISIQAAVPNKLIIYPAPSGAQLLNDFSVKVRQDGKQWQPVDTYLLCVDEVRGNKHQIENASMCYFDFSGKIEVSITFNNSLVETTRIRPLSYGIIPKVEGNTLIFELDRPRNLSIEVNGDIFHNLHLFANPIDTYIPNKKDPDLIYFPPGIHHLDNGELKVKSGQTVYLAGGSVIEGRIRIDSVENVKVLGRGKINHTPSGGIHTANSRNVLIEGIITTQCSTGGSENITIRNVKSISYFKWGDGMNVFASKHVLFDGVFCRNSDDCTTVYGTRNGFFGGSENITMQNSTLWADVAHPIFIGIHGNPDSPEILENLNYINIDILDQKERQIDYQGCLAINTGDNNLVRNVRFENIRIEDIRQGQLVNMRVTFNPKYCKAPGRSIENVLFKDISYNGTNAELSIISGYSDDRKIKNIQFENLKVNGIIISDDMPEKPGWYKTGDIARFFIGEHVENLTFTK